jgi:hypothetical protein
MARILALLVGILWPATEIVAAPVVISPGRENWLHPWVPDLRNPGKRIAIRPERRIDVVILADGYLAGERKDFDSIVEKWYRRFLTFPAWGEFRGAFRVRAIWTPSRTRATAEQQSHFAVGIANKSVSNTRAKETAAAIFAGFDQIDVNRRVAGKRYTHLVAVMLIKDEGGRNPSGVAKTVQSPDDGTVLLVGFGADSHHEFAHAFGGLRDEYINVADSQAKGKTPDRPSLLAASNLSYTKERQSLPWRHLAPGSDINPDRSSVIGVLWPGGAGAEQGVWHSEARCFMNGSHQNWDLAKTRRGANLRDNSRFCFWCEEILVAKTLYLTGQLGDSADGETLWKKWEELRPFYQKAFNVRARIQAQNQKDAQAGLSKSPLLVRPE